jgi:hypothetical protein
VRVADGDVTQSRRKQDENEALFQTAAQAFLKDKSVSSWRTDPSQSVGEVCGSILAAFSQTVAKMELRPKGKVRQRKNLILAPFMGVFQAALLYLYVKANEI